MDSRRVTSVTGTAVTGLQPIPLRACTVTQRDNLVAEVDVI